MIFLSSKRRKIVPALLNWSFDLQICNKQKQKLFDFFRKLSQPFYCFFAYLYFVFHKVIISLYTVICKPLSNACISCGWNDAGLTMIFTMSTVLPLTVGYCRQLNAFVSPSIMDPLSMKSNRVETTLYKFLHT